MENPNPIKEIPKDQDQKPESGQELSARIASFAQELELALIQNNAIGPDDYQEIRDVFNDFAKETVSLFGQSEIAGVKGSYFDNWEEGLQTLNDYLGEIKSRENYLRHKEEAKSSPDENVRQTPAFKALEHLKSSNN